MDSLFQNDDISKDGDVELNIKSTLAVKLRPNSIDDLIGQPKITSKDSFFRKFFDSNLDTLPASSIILFGPPGTGKTTLAYLLANQSGRNFVELSAVNATVKDVREVVEKAKKDLAKTGKETILFIDEVHRFSRTQQDVLLPNVENKFIILVAATTENPSFSIISPLLSRSILLKLEPLSDESIGKIIDRALKSEKGLNNKFLLSKAAKEFLVVNSGGDARKALVILEAVCENALAGNGGLTAKKAVKTSSKKAQGKKSATKDKAKKDQIVLEVEDFEKVIEKAFLRYDRSNDQHYDVISAFIKSVRGSDVDAALHYLARMIVGGEDPRFIARRLMISAAEDIGLADPSALQTAVAAAQAVQLVGMPEARIILAEATIHLATAPKSNKAYMAISQAIRDVETGKAKTIPNYLRDSRSSSATDDFNYKNTENSKNYKYAHDYKFAIAPQSYLPRELDGKVSYYSPAERGYEANILKRLKEIKKLLKNNKIDNN